MEYEYGLSTSDYASPQSPSSITTIVFGLPRKPTASITPYRSLYRSTAPTVEPVSLAIAKSHCRVDTDADNDYISMLITTARQYVEDQLDITLTQTTWTVNYDCFPLWEIILPRPPLVATTPVVVSYRDTAGVMQTVSEFQTDANAIPGRVFPMFRSVWPAVRGDENSVSVTFVAGAAAANIPAQVKHAILMLVGHWYAIREPAVVGSSVNSIPTTFETLLASGYWGGYR